MKTIDERSSSKVLCVLYKDPVRGYPVSYPRDEIPKLECYPGGQKLPRPQAIDFTPGELLASVSGELGLRRFLESNGHHLIVTSDKDGPNSVFENELPDADIVISQPFWPAYLTAERIAIAPKLKLAITAGIGSDHVDLEAAIARGITVVEDSALLPGRGNRCDRLFTHGLGTVDGRHGAGTDCQPAQGRLAQTRSRFQ
jgi:formate dehydrogenase